jgi:hypothetical protein
MAVDREWSASHTDRLNPLKIIPSTHSVGGCMGCVADLEAWEKSLLFLP